MYECFLESIAIANDKKFEHDRTYYYFWHEKSCKIGIYDVKSDLGYIKLWEVAQVIH